MQILFLDTVIKAHLNLYPRDPDYIYLYNNVPLLSADYDIHCQILLFHYTPSIPIFAEV